MSRDKQQGSARISPARVAAFEVLRLVGEGRGHSDELLHGRHLAGVSPADKNLATALVLGVLRWQIALDARVRPLLVRPDTKLSPVVEIALRLGAFQLLHMDRIPAHAALSESVELARAAGAPHAAGMVNAVLRKLATAPKAGPKLHESTAAFAGRLGHPLWLVERWVQQYGRATAIAICEADQREPGCGALFANEEVGMPVMDDGSRLVAEVAAASVPDARSVWDCCAAPGGKTLVLARRLGAADVLATDASSRRAKMLATRMEREAVANVRVMEADAIQFAEAEFDLVLCDVPCSGTGTLGRNPEIRHRLLVGDFVRQAERQRAILHTALQRLAPRGRLVYSTCSLEAEENEEVVAAVLEQMGGFQRVDVRGFIESMAAQGRFAAGMKLDSLTSDGVLRTLPGVGFDGDGFFAAVIERGE